MRKKFNLDFIGHRKNFFIISIVLVVFSILSSFIFGADLDIQFKGGTILSYVYDGDIDEAKFSADAQKVLGINVNYTVGEDFSTGKNNISLSLVSNDGITADKQFELTSSLQAGYPDNNIELVESSDVSPSSGKEFFLKCIVAVIFSAIVLILYIAVRFKNIGGWLAGLCAIIALVHDCIICYGTFIVCGMSINANFMAVILTILGYSINDTIVIYDRVRENERLYGKKMERRELVNLSINQSLTRSLNTSITTIFAMVAVTIFAFIFDVDSIISFSFPMIIGMISGVYSTICIAVPLWSLLEEKRDANKPNKKKAAVKAKA